MDLTLAGSQVPQAARRWQKVTSPNCNLNLPDPRDTHIVFAWITLVPLVILPRFRIRT